MFGFPWRSRAPASPSHDRRVPLLASRRIAEGICSSNTGGPTTSTSDDECAENRDEISARAKRGRRGGLFVRPSITKTEEKAVKRKIRVLTVPFLDYIPGPALFKSPGLANTAKSSSFHQHLRTFLTKHCRRAFLRPRSAFYTSRQRYSAFVINQIIGKTHFNRWDKPMKAAQPAVRSRRQNSSKQLSTALRCRLACIPQWDEWRPSEKPEERDSHSNTPPQVWPTGLFFHDFSANLSLRSNLFTLTPRRADPYVQRVEEK